MTRGIVDGARISPVTTRGIVDRATLSSPGAGSTTRGIVDKVSLQSVGAATRGIVDSALLRSAGSATMAITTGAFLMTTKLEPYKAVTLPVGTWTQDSGTTVAIPYFEMPAGNTPGSSGTVVLHNDRGMSISLSSYLHTRWGHDSSGYYPIRERPNLPAAPIYSDSYTDGY